MSNSLHDPSDQFVETGAWQFCCSAGILCLGTVSRRTRSSAASPFLSNFSVRRVSG